MDSFVKDVFITNFIAFYSSSSLHVNTTSSHLIWCRGMNTNGSLCFNLLLLFHFCVFLFHGLLIPAFHMTDISSPVRCSGHLFLLVSAASGEWGLHLGIEDPSVGSIMGICQTIHQWGYCCQHKWVFNSLRNTFIAKYCKSEHFFGKYLDRV